MPLWLALPVCLLPRHRYRRAPEKAPVPAIEFLHETRISAKTLSLFEDGIAAFHAKSIRVNSRFLPKSTSFVQICRRAVTRHGRATPRHMNRTRRAHFQQR